jgi:hypothetical protein
VKLDELQWASPDGSGNHPAYVRLVDGVSAIVWHMARTNNYMLVVLGQREHAPHIIWPLSALELYVYIRDAQPMEPPHHAAKGLNIR